MTSLLSVKPTWDLEWLRRQLPVLKKVIYLNVAHQGLSADPVADWTVNAVSRLEREGLVIETLAHGWLDEAKKRVAKLVNAEVAEIAFTRNATEALNAIVNGLDLQGEVLISDHEHPALYYGLLARQKVGDLKVRTFKIANSSKDTLANAVAGLGPSTRLIAFSHVSCLTGARLPVREICAEAARRGVTTLVDGAQAIGQFPVDVKHLGCDFYAANGHKWLYGPKGSGILYARRACIASIRPLYYTYGSVISQKNENLELAPTAARFEYGERGVAQAGMAATIEWLDGLGWPNLEGHLAEVSGELKRKVNEHPALTLHTPIAWNEASAITTFSVKKIPATDARDRLRNEFNIIVRRVLEYDAIRVSTAYFNTVDDVERLMSALDTMLRG